MMFKMTKQKCCATHKTSADDSYLEEANKILNDFERSCMTLYIDHETKQTEESIDDKLNKIKSRWIYSTVLPALSDPRLIRNSAKSDQFPKYQIYHGRIKRVFIQKWQK